MAVSLPGSHNAHVRHNPGSTQPQQPSSKERAGASPSTAVARGGGPEMTSSHKIAAKQIAYETGMKKIVDRLDSAFPAIEAASMGTKAQQQQVGLALSQGSPTLAGINDDATIGDLWALRNDSYTSPKDKACLDHVLTTIWSIGYNGSPPTAKDLGEALYRVGVSKKEREQVSDEFLRMNIRVANEPIETPVGGTREDALAVMRHAKKGSALLTRDPDSGETTLTIRHNDGLTSQHAVTDGEVHIGHQAPIMLSSTYPTDALLGDINNRVLMEQIVQNKGKVVGRKATKSEVIAALKTHTFILIPSKTGGYKRYSLGENGKVVKERGVIGRTQTDGEVQYFFRVFPKKGGVLDASKAKFTYDTTLNSAQKTMELALATAHKQAVVAGVSMLSEETRTTLGFEDGSVTKDGMYRLKDSTECNPADRRCIAHILESLAFYEKKQGPPDSDTMRKEVTERRIIAGAFRNGDQALECTVGVSEEVAANYMHLQVPGTVCLTIKNSEDHVLMLTCRHEDGRRDGTVRQYPIELNQNEDPVIKVGGESHMIPKGTDSAKDMMALIRRIEVKQWAEGSGIAVLPMAAGQTEDESKHEAEIALTRNKTFVALQPMKDGSYMLYVKEETEKGVVIHQRNIRLERQLLPNGEVDFQVTQVGTDRIPTMPLESYVTPKEFFSRKPYTTNLSSPKFWND